MTRWSDFWAAEDCVTLCLKLLSKAALQQVSDVNAICDLPEAVQDLPLFFKQVEVMCAQWLVQFFSASSADVIAQQQPVFMSLCSDAVKMLVRNGSGKQLAAFLSVDDINGFLRFRYDECGNQIGDRCDDQLFAGCKKWLLQVFGDVYGVIVSQERLLAFRNLASDSVEVWLDIDELCACENDVAVLVSLWYEKNENSDDSYPLMAGIRVLQISSSFRHLVLPHLEWFEPSGSDFQTFSLLMSTGSVSLLRSFSLPHDWASSARRGKLPDATANARHTLTFSFPRVDVVQMIERSLKFGLSSVSRSPLLYFGGFYWRVTLVLKKDALKVILDLGSKEMLKPPRVVNASYSLTHQQQDGRGKTLYGSGWSSVSSLNQHDLFSKAIRSEADVEEFMCDDHLVFKCRIEDVK